MNPDMQLAKVEDLPALLRLVEAYHQHDNLSFDLEAVSSALTALLENSAFGRIWLIQIQGLTIGYLAFCFGFSIEFLGRDAFIDEFYLEPAYRERGIGRKVLAWLREEAGNLGINALHLEVSRNNIRAKRLYESSGFTSRGDYQLMSLDVEGKH